ncbi:RND transporter [Bacillus sp. Root147]|nr:RND transporter [Bacillus sp. Root147]
MKKGIIILVISIILILFIGVNLYRAQGSKDTVNVNVTHLKEKQLTRTVMVPGTLKLADEQYVYYDAEKGEINNIHVTEGSRVQIGTPLLTYESDSLQLEQEQNKLENKSSQLQVESLNKQIKNLNKKQKELEKEMSKKEAQDQVDSESAQLDIDLEKAKIDVERNNLEAKSLTKKEENLEVKSKINGTVLEVDKEAVNKTSDIQKPIVHIGNTDDYIASGVVSEYDALNVKIGQPVTITSDVLPDKEWTGSVKQIDYLPQQQVSTTETEDSANQYPIEVKIDDESINKIKPGFKLLLQIETNKKRSKAIPTKSIVNEDQKKYVYTIQDNKAVRKEIKVGETTNKFVEVVSGISDKDRIVSNPSQQLTDGVEVNIQ